MTYVDIRNIERTADSRDPGREIELHLTGNMDRYMWSINGIKFADAEPLQLTYGERVRITLVNDTMMTHPIHLHGMWTELETGEPNHIPRKHTVNVQPGVYGECDSVLMSTCAQRHHKTVCPTRVLVCVTINVNTAGAY